MITAYEYLMKYQKEHLHFENMSKEEFDSFLNSAQGAQLTIDLMTEFAKLHVKEALKAALESIPCLGSSSDIATYEEVKSAVLNAYNLDNIK